MTHELSAEELDRTLDEWMRDPALQSDSRETRSMLGIAADLRRLPSLEFKERLRSELLAAADTVDAGISNLPETRDLPAIFAESMPALGQLEFSVLPAHPRNLLLSFASHAAVVALIVSGIWVGRHTVLKPNPLASDLTYIPLPTGDTAPHGGGGGGDQSVIRASRGTPPKFAEEQLAPFVIVVRNPNARLQVEPTVIGPPTLELPQSKQIGDLLSLNIVIPSNGTGAEGGIGSNHSTGIGPGTGPGVGSGDNGGCCTGSYRPGKGITVPHVLYDPEPEYSDEARRTKTQGIVVLSVTIDPTGRARNIHIARSLGMGLDEKAVEAVQKWRFAPGMKDGLPISTQVEVEVNFRLF